MSKLRNEHVSYLNSASAFIQRLAERVDSGGGDLDEIIYRFNSPVLSRGRELVIRALIDTMYEPVREPFEIPVSIKPLYELLPNLPKKRGQTFQSLKKQKPKFLSKYQLFRTQFQTSFESIHKFIASRGWEIPSGTEMALLPPEAFPYNTPHNTVIEVFRLPTEEEYYEPIPPLCLMWKYVPGDGSENAAVWQSIAEWEPNYKYLRDYQYFMVRMPHKG